MCERFARGLDRAPEPLALPVYALDPAVSARPMA